jgi:hypothetical protein
VVCPMRLCCSFPWGSFGPPCHKDIINQFCHCQNARWL